VASRGPALSQPSEPLAHIGHEARLAEFTIIDDVQPDISLLAHHLGDGAAQPAGIGGIIATIAARPGAHHFDHVVGPRQAAGMGRENPVGAVHTSLPMCLRTSPRFAKHALTTDAL